MARRKRQVWKKPAITPARRRQAILDNLERNDIRVFNAGEDAAKLRELRLTERYILDTLAAHRIRHPEVAESRQL